MLLKRALILNGGVLCTSNVTIVWYWNQNDWSLQLSILVLN